METERFIFDSLEVQSFGIKKERKKNQMYEVHVNINWNDRMSRSELVSLKEVDKRVIRWMRGKRLSRLCSMCRRRGLEGSEKGSKRYRRSTDRISREKFKPKSSFRPNKTREVQVRSTSLLEEDSRTDKVKSPSPKRFKKEHFTFDTAGI